MRLFYVILLSVHISKVMSRKYVSSSDESIENLLYYKDCQHKGKDTTEPAPRLDVPPPSSQRQPDCPFPKMCCSMSCGNDCGGPQPFQPFIGRQMEPLQNLQPIQPLPAPPRQPVQPQILQRGRKKKQKALPMGPMGGRRNFGFTKERIKGLISQDEDIRKILKDLVRVTMKKVDLLDMINTRQKTDNVKTNSEASENSEELQ